jgi:predicted nucleic acid-binding protein
MNNQYYLIDTCGWIEWFMDGVLAEQFTPYFQQLSNIIVPTVLQYELYKWVCRERDINTAQAIIELTQQGKIIVLDTHLALLAAKLAAQYQLSVADALIYAAAQQEEVELITSDNHFSDLPNVCYFQKS